MNSLQEAVSKIRVSLSRSPYSEVRQLEVEMGNDKVLLTGTLSSYFLKQMAKVALRELEPWVIDMVTVLPLKSVRNVATEILKEN